MAQPYVTGPCSLWAGVGSGGSPVFLGHAERSPSIQVRPSFSPVFNDIAGQRVPMDYIYDGEEGMVSVDLTRYNEVVYAALAARPNPGGSRGVNVPGDIGTLVGIEGMAFQLWLNFPYAAKAAMAFGAMPAGYHFYAAFLEGPDGLDGLGTTNRRLRLNFHCIRALISGENNLGQGVFLLYDHDMTAVDRLPIN